MCGTTHMVDLTYAWLATRVSGSFQEIKKLVLRGEGIETIEDLSTCVALGRLDLSRNKLRRLSGLRDNKDIYWLSVVINLFTIIRPCKALCNVHTQHVSTHTRCPVAMQMHSTACVASCVCTLPG